MNYKGVKDKTYVCKFCQTEFQRSYYSTRIPQFCSKACKRQSDMSTWECLEQGKVVYHATQRRLLSEKYGYKCDTCGLVEWLGQSITLQVDHIDGDPANNIASNLRLLCPNCHSQTATYKGGSKNITKNDKRSRLHREIYKRAKRLS